MAVVARGSKNEGGKVGRYRLVEMLGAGAEGVVYRASDEILGSEVALKRAHEGTPAAIADAKSEFRRLAGIDHPGICAVHDFGFSADGRPYFTMELLEGQRLDSVDLSTDLPRLLEVAIQLAGALHALHLRGLRHGDLKPQNAVLLDSPARRVVLADLGFARSIGPRSGDPAGAHPAGDPLSAAAGAPAYVAPEVVLLRPADARADLYSLGVCLFQLATGRLPFPQDNVAEVVRHHIETLPPRASELREGLPKVLDELIATLLEKDPQARPRHGLQVIDSLVAAAEELGVEQELRGAEPIAGAFLGRDADLARLRRALARAADTGSLQAVLLAGGRGIGKTRLLEELAWRAQLDDATVCRVAFDAEDPRPCAALAKLIAPLLRALGAAELESWRDTHPAASPFLDPRSVAAGRGSEPAPIQVAEALGELLAGRRGARPLALLVDRLEEAPAAARHALEILIDAAAAAPVLLVAAGRAGAGEDHPLQPRTPGDRVERLALAALPEAESEQLARSMLGVAELSGSFRALLRDESEGVPGRVAALLAALRATGRLTRREGVWNAEIAGVAFDERGLLLDESVMERLEALIAGLEIGQRSVLVAAALIGKGGADLLAEAADQPTDAVRVALRRLAALDLVRHHGALSTSTELAPAGECFSIGSAEAARAVLDAADPTELRARALAAAAALAARALRCPAAQRAELELRVARLTISAEAPAEAREWVGRAVATLRAGAASAAAGSLLGDLLDLERRTARPPGELAATLCELIEIADGAGAPDTVRERAQQLGALAPDLPAGAERRLMAARAWRWQADALNAKGVSEPCLDALRSGLEALGGETPAKHDTPLHARERAQLLHLHALQLMKRRALDQAREILTGPALAAAAGAPDPDDEAARLAATLAQVLRLAGDAEAALRHNGTALEHFRRRGDHARAAACETLCGILANVRGEHGQMARHFREALTLTEERGNLAAIMRCLGNLAYALFEAGQWDQALHSNRKGMALAEHLDEPTHVTHFLVNSALIHTGRGDLAEAEAELGRAVELSRQAASQQGLAVAVGNLGDCALARGAAADALLRYQEAWELGVRHELVEEACEARRRLAEAQLELGAVADAWEQGREALRLARRAGDRVELAQLCRLVGRHHERQERPEAAVRAYRRGLKLLGSAGGKLLGARIRHRLGVALALQGDQEAGLDAIREAEEAYRSLGMRAAIAALWEDRRRLGNGSGLSAARLRKMQALIEAARGITAPVAAPDVLNTVMDGIFVVTEAERGFLVTVDSEAEARFELARDRSGRTLEGPPFDLSRSALEEALDRGQPSIVRDVAASHPDQTTPSMRRLELKSIMCVPLRVETRVIGAIYVDSGCAPAQTFGPEDLALLESLASIAATSLDKARLYDELLVGSRALARSKQKLEAAFCRLNEAHEELFQADKMAAMGQMAAGIAHELRQPLTVMIGRLELLDPAEDEKLGAALQEIERQARRMEKLVRSINRYARRSAGQTRSIDPEGPIHEALALVRNRLLYVDLSVEIDAAQVTILADESQLQQILVNLLTNALDAMEDRETKRLVVRAGLAEGEGGYRIQVVDSGCGISAENRDRVFSAFYTTKEEDRGTGLGLSIVRTLVESHGGRVQVESEPGQGTSFTLVFPLADNGA